MRWIETQDLFFKQYKFERFIKVGPSSTLVGMATCTLKAKYETKDDSTGHVQRVFCASKDKKEIYYQFEDEPEAISEPDVPAEAANPASAPVAAAPVVVAAPLTANASPAASIKDVPICAVDILAVIVSWKLKTQLSEVSLSKSIKELYNGKSTLQDEFMGDLQGEFSSVPDKGEDLPLEEFGVALGSGHSGNLGKYSAGLVLHAIGGKIPGSFNISSAKSHLFKT